MAVVRTLYWSFLIFIIVVQVIFPTVDTEVVLVEVEELRHHPFIVYRPMCVVTAVFLILVLSN